MIYKCEYLASGGEFVIRVRNSQVPQFSVCLHGVACCNYFNRQINGRSAYSAFVLLFPFPSDVRQPRRFFGDGQDTVQ